MHIRCKCSGGSQGGWLGFRAAAAGGRFLQARGHGARRLGFSNANLGTWEQWEPVAGDPGPPWACLRLSFCNRRRAQVLALIPVLSPSSHRCCSVPQYPVPCFKALESCGELVARNPGLHKTLAHLRLSFCRHPPAVGRCITPCHHLGILSTQFWRMAAVLHHIYSIPVPEPAALWDVNKRLTIHRSRAVPLT